MIRQEQFIRWAAIIVGCLVTADLAWAACVEIVTFDFIGQDCSGSGTTVGSRQGRWVLEQGGTFEGVVTLTDSGAGSASRVRTVDRVGQLQTATYQGAFNSKATYQDTAQGVMFTLRENRDGVEAQPDGSVFSGLQTLDVVTAPGSASGGTGVPMTTTHSEKKLSKMSTDIFSGNLDVTMDHQVGSNNIVLSHSQTTAMNGVWTFPKLKKLAGQLIIKIVNGQRTVTDSRREAQLLQPAR